MKWEGTNSSVTSNVNIEWSILKNRYANVLYDSSSIIYDNGLFSYNDYVEDGADIVKATVTYKDKIYYCTLPVIVGTQNNDYKIKLLKGSGFRYVEYDSAGKQPQYSNTNPFKIQVEQKINNI
jgi:hypothetical protein